MATRADLNSLGELLGTDATEIAESVRAGLVTARTVAEHAVAAAEARSDLGAFWSLAADAPSFNPQPASSLPLAGVSVAVKDCIAVAHLPGGVGLQERRLATRDAHVVRVLRAAGAFPMGKTAMSQLGWSTEGTSPGYPPCINPRDAALAVGGSSGGSAAAVAAGIAAIGLGTDVAGSVRIPAAYCGIVGFRPAQGTVPLTGVPPIVPTFDQLGILARSVRDVAAIHRVLDPINSAASAPPSHKLRVAMLSDIFALADEEVAQSCELALRRVETPITLTETVFGWEAAGFGRVLAVELAKTWGARILRDPDLYLPEVRSSVEFGQAQSPESYQDALQQIDAERNRVAAALAPYDVVAAPTLAGPVPPAAQALTVGDATLLTRRFSALGQAVISVPCGSDSHGRPTSIQLAGASADTVLHVAALIEDATSAADD